MKSTDPEPHGVGMELEQYRTRLEQMVEEKSKDLIAIQENLEATNRYRHRNVHAGDIALHHYSPGREPGI